MYTQDEFEKERVEIGVGMTAKVYLFNGYAYKCFHEGYPKDWIAYEVKQQMEVCKSGLPVLCYYHSEFPNSIKMDLVTGKNMAEKFTEFGRDIIMNDFMKWFQKIHEVKGLDLQSVTEHFNNQIKKAPVTEEQKTLALSFLKDVEASIQTDEVLCHMDYHVLNVMYKEGSISEEDSKSEEGSKTDNKAYEISIIDWIGAKNGKPIWDYSRTYVIFYEFAAGLKRNYLKRVLALEGYTNDIFMKSVYVNAVARLCEMDDNKVHKLMDEITEQINY